MDAGNLWPGTLRESDSNSNEGTGRRATIAELLKFATDYLKVDYIFWCTHEPYYSNEVVPFFKGQGAQKH